MSLYKLTAVFTRNGQLYASILNTACLLNFAVSPLLFLPLHPVNWYTDDENRSLEVITESAEDFLRRKGATEEEITELHRLGELVWKFYHADSGNLSIPFLKDVVIAAGENEPYKLEEK